MEFNSNPQDFAELTQAVRLPGVERCLPYPGMTQVPADYSAFAQADSQGQEQDWNDLCPAYALALLTHRVYRLPDDDVDMETLWNELGGESTKLWADVSSVVQRAWVWLDQRTP